MSTRSVASRRGMTLMEVMVAAFLGSMILYVVLNLLFPAMRVSAVGTARVDLDQRASLTEERLIRALKTTSRAGVGIEPQGDDTQYLTVHPIVGSMPDSKQNWSADLTAFVWQNNSLTELRATLPTPPVRATTLPLDDLQEVLAGAAPRFRIDGITEFQVTLDSGPRVDFRFVLRKGTQTLTIRRNVFLVNSEQ